MKSTKRSGNKQSRAHDIKSRKPPRAEHEIFADLVVLCAAPGFAHAIAHFCFRDNLIRYRVELKPEDFEHMHSGSQLIRTEISTLIGLLAKSQVDYELPGSAVIDGYILRAETLLQELHESLASAWFSGFDLEAVKSRFNPFSTAEGLREPIFYGGESAYSFQYRELAKKKYASDRGWLQAQKGFDVENGIAVAAALNALLVEKQTQVFSSLRATRPDNFTFLPAFRFSIDELVARSRLDCTLVNQVINAFCLPSGDRNAQFTALQEYNATNATPILMFGEREFILFQPYSLLESLYESPFYWMGADKKYAPTALSHRGQYTEALAFERLHAVFGKHVYANVHLERKKGDELGEIDVLVIFGDRAIVLQAKSKRLTAEARKGNDAQLKEDFKKAIHDACAQAMECAEALIGGSCRLKNSHGEEISLSIPLKRAYPVCIVADHYPALAFQARQFLKYESTAAIAAPLVTDVFALDAITEMLETPLRLLSYLDLRAEHGHKALYNHELTLLSLHLRQNLWISAEYDLVSFGDDIGIYLDIAMSVRREGVPGPRTPDGILTRLTGTHVGRIISEIESKPDPTTIDLGLHLLSLGESSIMTINKGIETITSQAIVDHKDHDFSAGTGDSESGITIHCNGRPFDEAASKLLVHCRLRKYSFKATRWFGLAVWPGTGDVRFGLELDDAWQQDDLMDEAVSRMPAGIAPKKIDRYLEKSKKIGRNEPCPCGSGRKYKKCCWQRKS